MLLGLGWSLGWLAGCDDSQPVEGAVALTSQERARVLATRLDAEPPVDPTNRWSDDPRAAHLGRYLFFDTRLSRDGDISCATCHRPDQGFGDRLELGEGIGIVARNTPPLWNVAFNRWYFWDGRADTLWAQALGPLENPLEMGTSRLEVGHLIHGDAELRSAYEELFGALPSLDDAERFPAVGRPIPDDPFHPDAQAWQAMDEADREAVNRVFANVGKAIGAYERLLVSDNAPLDRFVRALEGGDPAGLDALSEQAQRGMKRFFGDANCHSCHTGALLTDREFHNVGLETLPGSPPDQGRFLGIGAVLSDPFNGLGDFSDAPEGEHNDKLVFLALQPTNLGELKTPGLRGVADTAPYMHDGRFATLEEVVRFYSTLPGAPDFGHREETLVPLDLDDAGVAELVAFLESLTGEGLDPALLVAPTSPRSSGDQ